MSQISSEYQYKTEKFIKEIKNSYDLQHIVPHKNRIVLISIGVLEIYFLIQVLLNTDINSAILITNNTNHFLLSQVIHKHGASLKAAKKQLITTSNIYSIKDVYLPSTKLVLSAQLVFEKYSEIPTLINTLYALNDISMFYGRYFLLRQTKDIYVKFQHNILSSDDLVEVYKNCRGYYRGAISKENNWCVSSDTIAKKIMIRVVYDMYDCNINKLNLDSLVDTFNNVRIYREQENYFSKKIKQFTIIDMMTGQELSEWKPFCTVVATK